MIIVPATSASRKILELDLGRSSVFHLSGPLQESAKGQRASRNACAVLKSVRALIAWSLLASISLAAPDQDDPAGALAVRPDAESQQIQAAALKHFQDTADALQKFQKSIDQGHLERIKPAQITAAYESALRLEELAFQLLDLGEPSGVDFERRAKRFTTQLDKMIGDYRKLPGMATKIDRSYSNISLETQRQMSAVTKAEKLSKAGKHTEAADILLEATFRARSMAVWFIGKKQVLALGQLALPMRTTFPTARKQRSTQSREKLLVLRNSLTPDFTSLLSDIQSASESVRSNRKVLREGAPRTGPQLITEFSQRWQQMHHAAIQCRALDWARVSATQQSDSEPPDQMLAGQKECAEQFFPALAKLITADSLHVSSAEVEARYEAYLQALAPLVSLSADRTIPEEISQALETLASKSAPFAEGAQNYRLAMSNLLRWRSRQAEAMAKSRVSKISSLDDALLEAVRAEGKGPGLVPSSAQDTSQLTMGTSVPDAMKLATESLLNQEVTVGSLVGFPDRGNLVVSRYQARNYAWFRRVEGWDAQVEALREDLMVHQAAPPLSLQAAVALSSAQRGDAAAAGGTIIGLALEPLVTRMATLSEQDGTLIPLGPLPREAVGSAPLSHVLMRFRLTPSWVRNRYFFVAAE